MTTLVSYEAALAQERDRLAEQVPKVTGLERPDAAFVPGKSTLKLEDLEWPDHMSMQADDAPPALASDTDPPPVFAYAPGERDAFPVGQAPGEAARWSEILASALRGSK
jgi:hypothetical protein